MRLPQQSRGSCNCLASPGRALMTARLGASWRLTGPLSCLGGALTLTKLHRSAERCECAIFGTACRHRCKFVIQASACLHGHNETRDTQNRPASTRETGRRRCGVRELRPVRHGPDDAERGERDTGDGGPLDRRDGAVLERGAEAADECHGGAVNGSSRLREVPRMNRRLEWGGMQ